jgi:hypothetical protein
MRRFRSGATYLNVTPQQDRIREAYGKARYAQLMALKDNCEPHNLFGGNQNIKPARQVGRGGARLTQ